MTATLFISDLHLHSSRPDAIDCFTEFLRQAALRNARLYILGDLFESWIGDDDPDPAYQRILGSLARFSDGGGQCFVMRGNRDFLIGDRFAAETGSVLLPDELVERFDGQRVLLMHGDLLCTDDLDYQAFRRRTRSQLVQKAFLRLPIAARRAIVNGIRRGSTRAVSAAPPAIMDVNTIAVRSYMHKHDVRLLIHGHTHRPAIHRLDLDDERGQRIVLGDWYTQGSVLEWNPVRNELQTLAFAARPGSSGRQATNSPTD